MFPLHLFCFISYACCTVSLGQIIPSDEDANLTVLELITKCGYPAEEHFVTTSDGYILRLHRIPHGINSTTVSQKVAFLMHGILSSSADWIITGPSQAFAYLLADAGYDVWMGNARGNDESRNNTTLDPDTDPIFWDFSWHEIGIFDVPESIDYVLASTGQEKLFYIGHSQGTTVYYVMASTYPEIEDKIIAHFSLAPVVYCAHAVCPLFNLKLLANPLGYVFKLLGQNEFLPNDAFTALLIGTCATDPVSQLFCSNIFFLIFGFSPQEMNPDMFPDITGHTPAGCATKQLIHYLQIAESGRFCQFDEGLNNMEVYGSLEPPAYDLSQITAPVYLIYSNNDDFSAVVDVISLSDEIDGACKNMTLISGFDHLDYLYGKTARSQVYDVVLDFMDSL